MRKVIENIKPMSSVQAHFLKHSLYAHEMGLVPIEDQGASPFACIRVTEAENPLNDSLLDDLLFRYNRNKVKERTDMSFLDYIALPIPVARYLDKALEKVLKPLEDEDERIRRAALNNIGGKDLK